MPLEREIKLRIEDLDTVHRKLAMLRPKLLNSRHFEENRVLDYDDGKIRSRGCLLRLRIAGGRCVLTFKDRLIGEKVFKTREEIETDVDDADAALKLLEMIGLKTWFRYEKFREEYELYTPGGGVHVSLDETPVGAFAELEGSQLGIRWVAEGLGYAESDFLTDSYYSLFVQWREAQRSSQEHMVFDAVKGS